MVTPSVVVPEVRAPDLPRPCRTLVYPVVPLVFIVVAVWLVINTLINRPVESVAGPVLFALGLPVSWYVVRRSEPHHAGARKSLVDRHGYSVQKEMPRERSSRAPNREALQAEDSCRRS